MNQLDLSVSIVALIDGARLLVVSLEFVYDLVKSSFALPLSHRSELRLDVLFLSC